MTQHTPVPFFSAGGFFELTPKWSCAIFHSQPSSMIYLYNLNWMLRLTALLMPRNLFSWAHSVFKNSFTVVSQNFRETMDKWAHNDFYSRIFLNLINFSIIWYSTSIPPSHTPIQNYKTLRIWHNETAVRFQNKPLDISISGVCSNDLTKFGEIGFVPSQWFLWYKFQPNSILLCL